MDVDVVQNITVVKKETYRLQVCYGVRQKDNYRVVALLECPCDAREFSRFLNKKYRRDLFEVFKPEGGE